MNEPSQTKAFAAELQALLKKHDVMLHSCGCCDGINVSAGDQYGQTLATWVEVSRDGFVASKRRNNAKREQTGQP